MRRLSGRRGSMARNFFWTSFLSRLQLHFDAYILRLSRFRRAPNPEEELTRYLFSRNYFSAANNRVKPSAFLPTPQKLETSVFRMIGLKRVRIQAAGDQLAREREQNLHGWANVLTGTVLGAGLNVEPDL